MGKHRIGHLGFSGTIAEGEGRKREREGAGRRGSSGHQREEVCTSSALRRRSWHPRRHHGPDPTRGKALDLALSWLPGAAVGRPRFQGSCSEEEDDQPSSSVPPLQLLHRASGPAGTRREKRRSSVFEEEEKGSATQ